MQAEGSFNLLLIPLAPLLGALFNLLFGRWVMRSFGRLGQESVHLVAIGAVAVSLFAAIKAVFQVMMGQGQERLVQRVWTWVASGDLSLAFDLLLDPLSAVMVLVVTGVGLLIHVFSVGYMAKDPDYHRYFAYLNLFMASMLILVLGKSLPVTFIGWEGVGLCSYLLIGFWFEDEAKATAGRKAFVVNRIGDFGFLLGMFCLYAVAQSLDYDAINAVAAAGRNSPLVTTFALGLPVATLASLLLFVGCTGKSAQIPLHVWLPDAMAGPTPVSALIHAATMVTAGVYLIVRLNPVFSLSPVTMAVVACIGAATAVMAAITAVTQNDIKRVLAYSTVSQLGFMFLACGVGAYVAAIFHLVTHAFFKACLFLGSGSVIEACHHEQDIRLMGGLRKKMPVTSATFFVSCLAIAGIFPFAGFFSKDEILLHAYVNRTIAGPGLNWALWSIATITAMFTAFYMFRLYYLTFEGRYRGDHHTWEHHVGEHGIMNFPLVVLAGLATVGGLLGWPHVFPGHFPHVLGEWLAPVVATSESLRDAAGNALIGPQARFLHQGHVQGSVELLFMGVSMSLAIVGILYARSIYREGPSPRAAALASRMGALYELSRNKFWFDELYHAVLVKPLKILAQICSNVFDRLFIDAFAVHGTAGLVGLIGNRIRTWQNGNLRRYLLWLSAGTALIVASIYANPTISKLGPNKIHTVDMGGLRPTLGPQAYEIKFLGFTWRLGKQAPPPPAPAESAGAAVQAPTAPAKPPAGQGGQP